MATSPTRALDHYAPYIESSAETGARSAAAGGHQVPVTLDVRVERRGPGTGAK
ncbi:MULTISPECIES: hypothetical protein [unclassified Streptomyces]|uniref:hypothetical protein n=1 Tax=unclassified Streptomyces TaxID=2593676 RepID=UPI000374C915|nr:MULTISPECIES: hypothetical protein [unclassified Streptomyces]MYT30872.1 hypothetical protein [Streptomyces sp. SID8354]